MAEYNPELESIVRELNEKATPGGAASQGADATQSTSIPTALETHVAIDSDSLDPLHRS